jgi:hypothetical protein
MTMQIDLSPQTEAWIQSEALRQGILPVDFVRTVIVTGERIEQVKERANKVGSRQRLAQADGCCGHSFAGTAAFGY